MISELNFQHARQLGAALWSELKTVESERCVTGVFARLQGDGEFVALKQNAQSSKVDRDKVLARFREGCAEMYDHCGIWRHSLDKPYGYSGDFAILEHVYDNTPHRQTHSPLGEVLDRWALNTVLPHAVRARKDTLRTLIERLCIDRPVTRARPLRVLSIGAGAARELREVCPSLLELLDITLLDSDNAPLEFAKARLAERGNVPHTLTGNFLRLKPAQLSLQEASFDLVYSFGVIDYLPDALAGRLLTTARDLMRQNGALLFCVKDTRHYSPWFYDWFYNWQFVPRTLEDGRRLASAADVTISRAYIVENQAVGIFECAKPV